MNLNMRYGKLFGFLGLSAVVFLGSALITESASSEEVNPTQSTSESSNEQGSCNILASKLPRSKRIDLFYYRNAQNVVSLLNELNLGEVGCARLLPLNNLQPGSGVGRGGGNTVFLYGTKEYISSAHQVIAPLDLPLPGIDLQLWGVQISSDKPDELAKVMTDVRGEINLTQKLVRDTFSLFQLEAQRTLAMKKTLDLNDNDLNFLNVANSLGYEEAFKGPRRLSLLDIFLVGKLVKDPVSYYQRLYDSVVKGEINEEGYFQASDERYQKYFDAMRETGNPPLERLFRSRGLKPECEATNPDDGKCEMWNWKEIYTGSVKSIDDANRRTTLEFAFQYGDFTSNPIHFNPEELQRTSEILNSELQQFTSFFQKDIEELFVRPTLINIQQRVARSKNVSFAQVGRTTISTLSGVETVISSSSQSAFEIPQSPNFEELLTRARTIEEQVDDFIPTETPPGGSPTEIVTAGPLPVSRLIGLIVALSDQEITPVNIRTGTNLKFTPGVLRDLNSAELNIDLTVVEPTFTGTQEADTAVTISRIGQQQVQTSVYTEALDFFDLSTFTNQATLDGGRAFFPVVGQLWHAIFGSIPVFGELFSFPRGNQNVLHESLLLTNSFITPTSLGLGLLYPIQDDSIYQGENFCLTKVNLFRYLDSLNPLNDRDQKLNFNPLNSFQNLSDADKKYLSPQDKKRCTK